MLEMFLILVVNGKGRKNMNSVYILANCEVCFPVESCFQKR